MDFDLHMWISLLKLAQGRNHFGIVPINTYLFWFPGVQYADLCMFDFELWISDLKELKTSSETQPKQLISFWKHLKSRVLQNVLPGNISHLLASDLVPRLLQS